MTREKAALNRRQGGRPAASTAVAAPAHPVLALQRSIGNDAVTRLLQRAPAARATENPTRTGKRIKGKPVEIAEKFATLRTKHRDDAHAVLAGLEFDHLWGGLKSDVTNDDEEHTVRIDRQVPSQTHSNIQIQTNGTSISLATALVPDTLFNTQDRAGVVRAVKTALRSSLDDGMQWEVYDAPTPQQTQYVKNQGKNQGRGGGKGNKGGGKNQGRGNRAVVAQ